MENEIKKCIDSYYFIWSGLNELYAQWAKKHGLTINALLALYVIQNTENCSQQDICRVLQLPKQTIHSILKKFEQADYISQQTNCADQRSKILIFTDKGKEYAGELLSKLYNVEAEAFRTMKPEQIKGFIESGYTFLENFRISSGREV